MDSNGLKGVFDLVVLHSSRKPGPWAAYVATDRFPSDVRRTVVGGTRVVSGAEKKII